MTAALPEIIVCGRGAAERAMLGNHADDPFDVVVSIHGPLSFAPKGFTDYKALHKLELVFEDVSRDDHARWGWMPVSEDQVAQIIELARETPPVHRMLVHCAQGISRSSATVAIFFAVALGPGSERQAFELLEEVRRHSWEKGYRAIVPLIGRPAGKPAPYEDDDPFRPNVLMIEKADRLLERGGQLVRAHRKIYPSKTGAAS